MAILGTADLRISQILKLVRGAVVELNRAVGEPIEIRANRRLIARGEADLYPRFGRTMEWDTAAGHAVLRAAGGQVLRLDDHQPLVYGKPGFENPFFLALPPGVALCPAGQRHAAAGSGGRP